MSDSRENTPELNGASAKFGLGQVVNHRLFGYRGVIVDVDSEFLGSEAWYEDMAESKPPKDKPWYHVLVHAAEHQTYVAERNLETDGGSVEHPLVPLVFADFDGDKYRSRFVMN
jgi:heat shock protein HspQ